MKANRAFIKTWIRNNILAYSIGLGLLHPILAHGFTGDHGVSLTVSQLISHTISLFAFAALATFMQNKSLEILFDKNPWSGVLLFLFIPTLFFWIGYYTLYIPFDIVFLFTSIGTINAIQLREYMINKNRWIWQSVLSMFLGAVVGSVVGIGNYFWWIKDIHGLPGIFFIWILISLPGSAVAFLLSGYFLRSNVNYELSRT